MNISVLKEIKEDENRVAIQPKQVEILIAYGHKVFVAAEAGINAGFMDDEYIKYGAQIVDKITALNNGELILKVKAPLETEYNDYRADQILFTYLHFDENISPDNIKKLIKTGFLGIAYEWVGINNDYPLLHPMSRLTGYLFAQKSSELLMKYKGKLPGKYESEHFGANALIIGTGTIGMSAIKYFDDNNINITVVDKNPNTLENRLENRFTKGFQLKRFPKIINFNNDNPIETKNTISDEINTFDIILNCAVRRSDLPKAKMDFLISSEMIKKMSANSVICDTTACDSDLIETCISSSSLEHIDIIDNVIHYNCDHIPSYVGNTSTRLLTDQTFKYILEIANNGYVNAIKNNEYLRNGVSCYKGFITHKYSANKKNMMSSYRDIATLID